MEPITHDDFEGPNKYISWGSILAGSIVTAALAAVLHGFGASVGLATSSSAPTWRDASVGLWILTGVYLMLVALASYGLGGYVTGWLRGSVAHVEENAETSHNLHGLIVWAIATLLTLLIIAAAIGLSPRNSATSNPSVATVGESLIAYDLDRLLRGDLRASSADQVRYRGEAGRILLTAGGRNGVSTEDRQYLVRLVSSQTNLSAVDAERRVDTTIVRASESISRARKSGVVLGFMASSAILLGLVAAWLATPAGAKHSFDRDIVPIWGRRMQKTSSLL